MCRGNHRSSWIAEGSYEAVAEILFSEVRVDGLFMEWDSERAGGFEPLRFVPKGQVVVLGLVTSKFPELEDKDTVRRRLEEASHYVDVEYLCLSPQCGFASTHEGNKLSEDEQRRKLELVVELADEFWGGVGQVVAVDAAAPLSRLAVGGSTGQVEQPAEPRQWQA